MSSSPIKSLVLQAVSVVEDLYSSRGRKSPATTHRCLPPKQEDRPVPNWLKPNANRDLAVRAALGLALKTRVKGGYLALGEPALQAVMRMWLMDSGVKPEKALRGEIEEKDFPRLTAAAGRIACSKLVFSNQDVPKHRITQTTRQFIEDSQLEFLVVDDPDVETLSDSSLLPELESWRIRMEFREAVRGTNVMMILPG